jgi:hypothetical protein
MKVPQFDPVADAIRPLHFGTYLKKLQARRKLELAITANRGKVSIEM